MRKEGIFLSAKAKEKLQNYQWPGNIRELLNTIERALILCKSKEITENDIILPEKPFSLDENFNFSGNLKQVTGRATRMVEKIKIEKTLKQVGFNKTTGSLYWRALFTILLKNPKATESVVSLAAMYIHFAKHSRFIIELMNEKIKKIEANKISIKRKRTYEK